MKTATKFTAFLLAALLLLSPLSAFADTSSADGSLISPAPVSPSPISTVDYYRSNKTLSDWWEVLALTAAGVDVKAEGFVLPALDGDSISTSGSPTALAKAILSLGAIGENPRFYFGNAADRDLVRVLASLQGENGAFGAYLNEHIYAVIALELTDPSAYDRDAAIVYLCSCRLADGGFAYYGDVSDVDLTAMALLALQYFRGDRAAEEAIESSVAFLVSAMSEDGAYPSAWEPGVEPSESVSAVISGFVAVGIDMTVEPYAKLARKLAEYCRSHPKVERVSFVGFDTHPSHENARKYYRYGSSAVFTVELKGTLESTVRFVESLRLAANMTMIGDSITVVTHPASTTHKQLSDADLTAAGVTPTLLRISLGLENADDLIEDFEQAFAQIG